MLREQGVATEQLVEVKYTIVYGAYAVVTVPPVAVTVIAPVLNHTYTAPEPPLPP